MRKRAVRKFKHEANIQSQKELRTEQSKEVKKKKAAFPEIGETGFGGFDLSPKREDELLDELAKKIVGYGMTNIAIILLETIKPAAFVQGQLIYAYGSPFFDAFGFGILSDYAIVLQRTENIERLLRKIESLNSN